MSFVAIISVPNIFVKMISPIFTGALTEVFRIISIISKIFSFGTGLAVFTLTIVFSRFSTLTMLVTVRVGGYISLLRIFHPWDSCFKIYIVLSFAVISLSAWQKKVL